MLTFLREWALSLSGVAIFGSVCEVILPEGSFQKYIRLTVGMLLVLTLLTPMEQIFHIIPDAGELVAIHSRAYEEREEMEDREKEAVLQIYRENLNQKLLTSLKQRLGEKKILLKCQIEEDNPENFGTIKEVQVFLYPEESYDIEEIQKICKEDYGIPKERVIARYLKERNG